MLFLYLRFPLKEKERLHKWVHAVRRKDFKPTSSSTLCSLHFHENDFYSAVVSGKQMLKKSAVPTIFNFPNNLTPKIKERRILQREVSKYTYKNKYLYFFILLDDPINHYV